MSLSFVASAVLRNLLDRRRGRCRVASGGALPKSDKSGDDSIPVILSPGRSTTLRPGETHLEAMERLMRGEDL
ncbi:hypothetical protein ACGFNU_20985 [Spirillospora sp. NPDC048911]|uniref:hypothetical protein n=1 Tax=Spirillospora sp. NPDC048911 TaxID=3364527 RepID=UPI0037204EFB